LQYREDLAQVTLALATSLLEVRHKQLQHSTTPLADASRFFAGLAEVKSLSIFKERLQDAMNGLTLQVQQDVQQYTKRKSTLHQISVYLQRVQSLSRFLELMVLVLGKDSLKLCNEEVRLDILNTMVGAAELLESALYRSKDLNIMRLGEHRDLPYSMIQTANQILSAMYVYLHGPCSSQLDRLSSSFFDVMRELLLVVPMTEAFNVSGFAHPEVGDSTLAMMRLLGDLLAMIVNTESACTQMINALLVAHETFGALGSCMEWLLQHLRIFDADVDLNTVLAGWHAGNCTFQQEKEMLRDCLSRKSGNASNGGKDSDPMADAQLLRADAFDDLLDIYIAFLTLVEKVRFLASNDSANEKFWEAISPLNQQYHEYLLQTHIGGVEIVNTGPTATQPWPGGPRLEKCYFRVPKLVYRHWNVPQMRRIRKLLFRQMPRQRSETEKLRLFVRLSLRLMNTLIKLDQCEGSADDWVLRSSWLWAHGTAFLAVLINLLLLIQDWLSRSNDGAASVADLDALKRIILVISILHAVFFSVWIYSGSLLKASEDTIVLDVLRGLRNDDKLSDRGDLYNLKRSPWTLGSDVDASGRSLPVGGGTNKASSIGRLLRPFRFPKPWHALALPALRLISLSLETALACIADPELAKVHDTFVRWMERLGGFLWRTSHAAETYIFTVSNLFLLLAIAGVVFQFIDQLNRYVMLLYMYGLSRQCLDGKAIEAIACSTC
jgi:hypothetical protein